MIVKATVTLVFDIDLDYSPSQDQTILEAIAFEFLNHPATSDHREFARHLKAEIYIDGEKEQQ